MYIYALALCWGSTSCSNGGTCTSPNTCVCAAGWTGSRCTTGTERIAQHFIIVNYMCIATAENCNFSKIGLCSHQACY